MGLTGDRAAHLASEAVAIQNKGASFLAHFACKRGSWFGVVKDVFARLQIIAIIVREDKKTFFVSQLPNSPRPFADSASDTLQFVGGNYAPEIG